VRYKETIGDMQHSSIFQWRQGAGWLVFSGGGAYLKGETETVDMAALTRSAADGALIYVGAASDNGDDAEQYLAYLGELGGRSGYTLDIVAEDDDSLRTQLSEAGIIIIGDGLLAVRLRNSMHGAVIEGIERAYAQGALVMGIGIGAALFGEWVVDLPGDAPAESGFAWLANVAILSGTPGDSQRQRLQAILHANPTAFGLGIWPGSALTLGPEGQVELWGKRQISISLGQAYSVRE
jgi:hypothetical protein